LPTHDLTVHKVPVGDLRTYYRNPRRGNTTVIARSLKANGQYKALTVNRGTHTGRPNEVLAGNHTLMAARDIEWEAIDVSFVDVDEDQAARIVAIDNRSSDLATNDDRILLELLAEIANPEDAGYDPGDIAALEALLATHGDGGGGDSDEDVLKASDRAGWPIIRMQVPPDVHARWQLVPGDTDEDKLVTLLDHSDVA
jgi:ParB-like chromosome segregation protein Spo0J